MTLRAGKRGCRRRMVGCFLQKWILLRLHDIRRTVVQLQWWHNSWYVLKWYHHRVPVSQLYETSQQRARRLCRRWRSGTSSSLPATWMDWVKPTSLQLISMNDPAWNTVSYSEKPNKKHQRILLNIFVCFLSRPSVSATSFVAHFQTQPLTS